MNKIDKIIDWFEQRQGKVEYSMSERSGKTGKYDCSSSMYFALVEAFKKEYNHICNTTTLPNFLQNLGFKCIAHNESWEAKRGDIVIWQKNAGRSGATAHTGIFVNNEKIIHCNYNKNGISTDTEKSLMSLYNYNWWVYRLNNDFDTEQNFSQIENISERYMVNGNYSIDSLPWWCFDKNQVGTTAKYQGYVVTVSRKWGNYWYSQYLGGWIDYRAFEEVETISEEKTVNSAGYSIDTKPWGTKGFETVGKSDELIGKTFEVTARKGAYLYIHEKAKWVDEKAFE